MKSLFKTLLPLLALLALPASAQQIGPTPGGGSNPNVSSPAAGSVLPVANSSNLTPLSYVLDYLAPPGDVVSSCAAGYGLVKIVSNYTGNPIQMRVIQSGSYVTQNIPFKDNFVDIQAADAFAQTRDAGTVPELRFYDQCGGGYDSTFQSGNYGAIWSLGESNINGLRTAYWDDLHGGESGGGLQGLNLPVGLALNEDAYSFAFIGSTYSKFPAFATTLGELEGTSARIEHFESSSGTITGCPASGAGLGLFAAAANNGYCIGGGESDPELVLFTSSSSALNFYLNGANTSVSKTAFAKTSAGGQLGYSQNTGTVHSSQMNALAFVFWNKTLSATETANLQTYVYELVGYPNLKLPALWGIGDSTLEGEHENTNNIWLYDVNSLLNMKFALFLDGTSSEQAITKEAQISRISTLVRPGVMNAAFVQMGYNDVGIGGYTPAQAITHVTGLCDLLHTAGFYPVIAAPSQKTNTTSMTQANQDALWNGLASSISGHCDAISGSWADPIIGSGGDPTNTTYYYTDQIHLTAAGHRIMATYALTALQAFVK